MLQYLIKNSLVTLCDKICIAKKTYDIITLYKMCVHAQPASTMYNLIYSRFNKRRLNFLTIFQLYSFFRSCGKTILYTLNRYCNFSTLFYNLNEYIHRSLLTIVLTVEGRLIWRPNKLPGAPRIYIFILVGVGIMKMYLF